MDDLLKANPTFKGAAIPSTNPGIPDGSVFYIASTQGTYANFGGFVLDGGFAVLSNISGSWSGTKFLKTELDAKADKTELDQLAGEVSQKITGIPSKNLFDKNTATEGYYVDHTKGNLVPAGAYCVSDWIPVKPNTSYARTSSWQMAWYDANKVYISGDAANAILTSPSNAAFARVSMTPISIKETFQFEEGTAKTAYESFGFKLNGANIVPETLQLTTYEVVSAGKFLDDIRLGYIAASNDFSFLSSNPWIAGTGETMTWNDNVNEFTSGLNYVQIVQTGGLGQMLRVEIPAHLRIAGRKIKFIFRYKCDKQLNLRVYLWSASTSWVNNAGAATQVLPLSTTEKVFSVERAYESGATHIAFYVDKAALATLKIGSIQLFAESGGYESPLTGITKTVATDGSGDYTSIRAAVKANSGTASSPLTVFVKNGTYNEIDIAVGDYTNVIGESRDGVIVITDGSSTDNAPADFYGGVPINTIDKSYKHQWKVLKNARISNLTSVINDVKYSNHSDGNGIFDYAFENVAFIRLDDKIDGAGSNVKNYYLFIAGIGAHGNQKHRYIACTFDYAVQSSVGNSAGIYFHNWNQEDAACLLQIDKCYCQSSNLAWIDDLGSGQKDVVQITESVGDVVFSSNGSYLSVPNINVPYSFDVSAQNHDGWYFPTSDRPNIWMKINSDSLIKCAPIFSVGDYCKSNKPLWIAATSGVDATHRCVYTSASYSYLQIIE